MTHFLERDKHEYALHKAEPLENRKKSEQNKPMEKFESFE